MRFATKRMRRLITCWPHASTQESCGAASFALLVGSNFHHPPNHRFLLGGSTLGVGSLGT